jgi:shikimate kinase
MYSKGSKSVVGVFGLIALIGLPGSGKSTVGRQLARRLQLPFLDSDHAIEERLGCSIRDYFGREGEASFRDVEAAVIEELTSLANGVLSTGGGSVLRPANRQHLRERGHVVYLRSSPDELFRRLRHDVNRPLLQVADPLGRLRDLYTERDPLYRETAHFVIETGRPSVSTLVNMIVMQLELAGVLTSPPLPLIPQIPPQSTPRP